MPATAANQPDEADSPLASVVSLASRRGARETTSPVPPLDVQDTGADLQEQARRHWETVFTAARIDLGSPQTAAVIGVVAKELERIVSGLLVIREGRGDALPANPDAGVDLTGAVEVTGVLRDLANVVETARG
ncbi:hypothetical protein ACFVY4_26890 [Streptomyces sp. NPDC058299]|uniref:hypothetical protein n=1 Tax=Streptomyces sp. NPDC058299 TaxID=3346435 RepID=UPI0036EA2306